MSKTAGIKTAPLMAELKLELDGFKDDIKKATKLGIDETKDMGKGIEKEAKETFDKVGEEAKKSAKDASKAWEEVADVGSKISDFGDKVTTGISLPVLGAGTALGVMANNSENALNSLESKLGVTGEEAERLKGVAKGIYTDGFGESIENVVDDLAIMQQNLVSCKNWTDDTKQSTLESIMAMNDVFGTETQEVTRALKVMQDSGLSDDIEHSMDVITRGFQLGGNYSDELLDTMMEYSPQFVKLGLSADEAMNYLITGANNGAFSLDKVGDAMKEFAIRSIDGSKSTEEGFKAIGLNAKTMAEEFGKGGDAANAAFKKTLDGLANLKDPVERETAGVALFGTMWEDMGQDAMVALAGVEGGLEGVDGASEAVLEKQREQREFTSVLREFQMAIMPIGTEIMKIAKDCLPQVKEIIGDVRDTIAGLTDEQKENILKWGAIAVVAGPVIKTVGGGIEVFGNVGKAFSGLNTVMKDTKGFETAKGAIGGLVEKLGVAGASGGSASLAGSLTALALPAGLAASALSIVALGAKGTADYLTEEAAPAVDLFADATIDSAHAYEDANGVWREQIGATRVVISDETKQILGTYMEMDKGVRSTLEEWKVNTELQTEEGLQGMSDKFAEMGNYLRTQEQIKYEGMLADTSKFLADNGALTAEEQANALGKLTENHTVNQTLISENEAKIKEILSSASQEKRTLTSEEMTEITGYQNAMQENAVSSLSKTEEESLVIEQRLKDERGRITAESASEMIQQANKARDEEVKAANEKYTETIKEAGRLKEAGVITDEQYQNMIDKAKETKTEQINKAEEACSGIKTKIENATPGIGDAVDMNTGAIKTKWEELSTWVTNTWNYINSKGKDLADWWTGGNYGGTGVAPNYQRPEGAFYNGLSYVPTDLYPALLHKGERVLTAKENYEYTQGLQDGSSSRDKTEINLYGISNAEEIANVLEERLVVMGLG